MKKRIAYLLMVMVVISCNNEKKQIHDAEIAKNDTLSFTYKTVQAAYTQKQKMADTSSATITYPEFDHKPLNEYIKRQVFDYFSPDEEATSYQDIANSFISGYKDFAKESSDRNQTWYLNINIHVLRQTHNYIAIAYNHEDYAGGAHGNHYTAYLNYNLKNNKDISIDSLFDATQKAKLIAVAEGIFRKNEGLTPDALLTDNYFFEDGKFNLAKNFYMGQKGLIFLYNIYEIKPYVDGTTELIVPFKAIKNIIKPNSFLSTLL